MWFACEDVSGPLLTSGQAVVVDVAVCWTRCDAWRSGPFLASALFKRTQGFGSRGPFAGSSVFLPIITAWRLTEQHTK